MKKRILSILVVCCLMVTMIPAVFATDVSGLQTMIDNTAAGGSVQLHQNYVLTDKVTINKEITIQGNGNSITYNGGGSALVIDTNSNVEFENVSIISNHTGIELVSVSPQVTLTNCEITVPSRGIRFASPDAEEDPDFYFTGVNLTLDDTTIKSSELPTGKNY